MDGYEILGTTEALVGIYRIDPPYLQEGGGTRVPNSIYLVFPIKWKMEFQRSPPSPNSIFERVGIRGVILSGLSGWCRETGVLQRGHHAK